jgi:hypothetical protein
LPKYQDILHFRILWVIADIHITDAWFVGHQLLSFRIGCDNAGYAQFRGTSAMTRWMLDFLGTAVRL